MFFFLVKVFVIVEEGPLRTVCSRLVLLKIESSV